MCARPQEHAGLSAWMAFIQAHSAVMEDLETELQAEAGITVSWYEVLLFLEGSPEGRLTMQQVAGSVRLSKSGVTRLVDRMAAAGLLERTACATDRRVTYAAITEAGRRAVRTATPVHLRGIEAHFSRHLSAGELTTLRSLMRKILEGQGRAEHVCAPPSVEAEVATPAGR